MQNVIYRESGRLTCKHPVVFSIAIINAIFSICVSTSVMTHLVRLDGCTNVTTIWSKNEVVYDVYSCSSTVYKEKMNIVDNAIFFSFKLLGFNDCQLILRIWLVSRGVMLIVTALLLIGLYTKGNCCTGLFFLFPWMVSVMLNGVFDTSVFILWYKRYEHHASSTYLGQALGYPDIKTQEKLNALYGTSFQYISRTKIGILMLNIAFDVFNFVSFFWVCSVCLRYYCNIPKKIKVRAVMAAEPASLNKPQEE